MSPVLIAHYIASGVLGTASFSAAPVTLHQMIARFRPEKGAEDLLAMLVFGLIIAFCARRLGARAPSPRGMRSVSSDVSSP